MSRQKTENIQRLPPVNFDMDDPQQKAFWDYYQELTHKGEAADWIRSVLIAALPTKAQAGKRISFGFHNHESGSKVADETTYEDIE